MTPCLDIHGRREGFEHWSPFFCDLSLSDVKRLDLRVDEPFVSKVLAAEAKTDSAPVIAFVVWR